MQLKRLAAWWRARSVVPVPPALAAVFDAPILSDHEAIDVWYQHVACQKQSLWRRLLGCVLGPGGGSADAVPHIPLDPALIEPHTAAARLRHAEAVLAAAKRRGTDRRRKVAVARLMVARAREVATAAVAASGRPLPQSIHPSKLPQDVLVAISKHLQPGDFRALVAVCSHFRESIWSAPALFFRTIDADVDELKRFPALCRRASVACESLTITSIKEDRHVQRDGYGFVLRNVLACKWPALRTVSLELNVSSVNWHEAVSVMRALSQQCPALTSLAVLVKFMKKDAGSHFGQRDGIPTFQNPGVMFSALGSAALGRLTSLSFKVDDRVPMEPAVEYADNWLRPAVSLTTLTWNAKGGPLPCLPASMVALRHLNVEHMGRVPPSELTPALANLESVHLIDYYGSSKPPLKDILSRLCRTTRLVVEGWCPEMPPSIAALRSLRELTWKVFDSVDVSPAAGLPLLTSLRVDGDELTMSAPPDGVAFPALRTLSIASSVKCPPLSPLFAPQVSELTFTHVCDLDSAAAAMATWRAASLERLRFGCVSRGDQRVPPGEVRAAVNRVASSLLPEVAPGLVRVECKDADTRKWYGWPVARVADGGEE